MPTKLLVKVTPAGAQLGVTAKVPIPLDVGLAGGGGAQGPPGPPGPAGGGAAFRQTIGDGTSSAFAVVHGLGSRDVSVTVYNTNSPWNEVVADVEHTDLNTVTVRTQAVPITNGYTVVVNGPGTIVGSGIAYFVYTQVSPAATWDIVHNLGYFPNVSIVDSGNNTLETDIHYVSANELQVLLSAATSGKAYLS